MREVKLDGICDECGQYHTDLIFIPGPTEDADYWMCVPCQDAIEDMADILLEKER